MLARYPFHDVLDKGSAGVGVIINFFSPAMVELAGCAGFDFVIVDCEHGPMSAGEAEQMIRAAELARIAPLVRIPTYGPNEPLRYLDAGATGIVFPKIETRLDAEQAVRSLRYPPLGCRGVAVSTHAAGYGRRMPFPEYVELANELMLCICTVETRKGIAAIEDIANADGVSALIVGTSDLSAEIGCPNDFDDPRVVSAIERVIACAKPSSVPVVLGGNNIVQAKKALNRGAQLLLVVVGGWFVQHGSEFISRIKEAN
jgi:4-hydroxy-2-oxoheptanedioate aldolase